MTNYYLQEGLIPPLGLAVKMLGGAITQLERAPTQELMEYTLEMLRLYEAAEKEAPRDSLVSHRHRIIGKNMKLVLSAMMKGYRDSSLS
jgi:hypothetical protein